jgi:branched-chain amino acid transport system ATP-binding protein
METIGDNMGILKAEGLKKYFGEVHAVDGVSLEIKDGEFVSVVGPNGSGKTTLVNLISGALLPDSGVIYFEGRDITKLPAHQRVKLGIGRSFQIPMVYEFLSSLDNILVSILSRNGHSRIFHRTVDKFEGARKEAMELLKIFSIPLKLVAELPHGHRKLLDVAMALALQPRLVLLDEPTSGISLEERDQVMGTIAEVLKERKIAAVIVEHDMDIVAEYSDRILVMHDGKILKEGGKEVLEDEEVRRILIGD